MIRNVARNGDVISGACLAAFGAYILVTSLRWSYVGPDGPGPGFFPFWYGLAILALSLALVLSRVLRASREAAVNEASKFDWRGVSQGLMTWGAFTIAVVLLEPLGFLISFGLLTLFITMVVFRRSLLESVITTIIAAAVFHLVFNIGFGMRLPVGSLGF